LHAAEPVEIIITGIEGDALKNVREALVLPAGLVRDGTIDQLWLERFARQANDKTRSALEPFGYYNALVTVTVEPVAERYHLLVEVIPGEPVRLTEVTVTLAGQGFREKRLNRLVTTFPLKKGDVLLQQRYEVAKAALKSRAQDLGYLDAEFSLHEIRIEKTATTATVELVLDTGARYYFGETTIQGRPAIRTVSCAVIWPTHPVSSFPIPHSAKHNATLPTPSVSRRLSSRRRNRTPRHSRCP